MNRRQSTHGPGLVGRAAHFFGAAGLHSCLLLLVTASVASAQTFRFEDVVGNLRHSDPGVRRSAMRLLAEAGYAEAAVPLAALLTDPIDEIRLEAIATEITLLAGRRFPRNRHVAGIVEVRNGSVAESAFRAGAGLGVRQVPAGVARGLLAAMRDQNRRVRAEATYAFGALAAGDADLLGSADLAAAFGLLSGALADRDPRQRLAAAAVAARVVQECGRGCLPADPAPVGDAFVNGLNDPDLGVRTASMRVLGLMRYDRAIKALTDQFAYYDRGVAAEAALDGLAHIAHPSSAALFWSLLGHQDAGIRQRAVEGVARLGDTSHAGELETTMAHERSDQVNLAVMFALQRLGRGQRVDPLVAAASREATRDQAREYLIELGGGNVQALTAYLQDPTPELRLVIVDVLGHIGSKATVPALQPLTKDRDPNVAAAAERSVARLSRK